MIGKRMHAHPNAGLQIILRRIRGVTDPGVLKQPYHFQISPLDEFGVEAAGNWTDYQTISGGTFTRDGSKGLDTISFQAMVVDFNPSWAVKAGGNEHHERVPFYDEGAGRWRRTQLSEIGYYKPNPQRVAGEMRRLERALTPFMLVAHNKGLNDKPDLRMPVTLRNLSVREKAGEPDARYFDLSFTQYRRPKLKRKGYAGHPRKKDLPAAVSIDKDGIATEIVSDPHSGGVGPGARIGTKAKPATLRRLAKHFYGQPSEWKRIAAKNGLKNMGGSQSLEKIGRRGRRHRNLTIPKITRRKKDGGDSKE